MEITIAHQALLVTRGLPLDTLLFDVPKTLSTMPDKDLESASIPRGMSAGA